jgi:hypothetical protein
MNAFGIRLMEILSQVDKQASANNVGRRRLAMRLGVSEHTIAAWFKPSRASMMPADRFFELACREDLLPKPARDALWTSLGREGGYIVVPQIESGPNGVAPLVHLADIAAALGALAASVRKETAHANGSENGGLTRAKTASILDEVHQVAIAITQMRAALEELQHA